MAAENELAIVLTVIGDQLRAGFASAGAAVGTFAAETEAQLAAAGAAVGTWAAETKAQLIGVEESGGKLGELFSGLVEAFAAEQIVKGLKDMVVAAAEARDPLEVAAQVAQNLGHAFDGAKAETFLEGLATSGQAGLASIQDLRSGFQILTQVTNTQAQASRATAIAANLAAARHMSFADAVGIVSKVLTGHVALLGRYGFATKDASGKTLDTARAMEALDKATAGAAAKLGGSLPGQLAALSNDFSLLSESVAAYLVPALTFLVELLRVVIDWFDKLSPGVKETIAVLGGLAAAFAVTLLVLPLLVTAIELVQRSFGILGVITSGVGRAFTLFGPIARALGLGLLALRDAFFGVAVAEGAAEAPMLGIVAATALVVAAIVLIGNNLDALGRAWTTVVNVLSTAWAEFVHNVLSSKDQLLTFFRGIVEAMNGQLAEGVIDLSSVATTAMPKTVATFTGAFKSGITSVTDYFKSKWAAVTGWLGTQMAQLGKGPAIPKVAFDDSPGEGAGAKKGKKGAGAGDKPLEVDGVKDQLDAARAAIAAVLDAASDDVDRAKAGLEAATANLDAYKASIGGKVTSADQAAHEQALITAEMEKQRVVEAAIAAQKKATEAAAAQEGAIANRLTEAAAAQLRTTTAAVDAANRLTKAHSAAGEAARKTAAAQIAAYKTLSSEAATFLTAQGKHVTEAINLGAALSRAGIVLSDLIKAMKEPGIELADQTDKILDERAKVQQAGVTSTLDTGEASIKGTEDTDRHQDDMEKAAGKEKSPVRQDAAELKTAKLDEQLEELRLTAAKASAGIAIYTASLKLAAANASGDAAKIREAQEALTLAQTDGAAKISVATTNVATALDNVAVASTKLATDTANASFSLTTVLTTMAQKITALIPGLSMNNAGALLFNWQAALGAALQKTQAYAKIQQLVTQLMNLFAQIIDKLMPVIEVLINIITAIANGFVALWNIVAKLLSIIGIQIGDLTDLNNGLVPLISVVHNIPTLNELAAGKTKSPLSQNPVALNAPVVAAVKSPGLGGGIFAKLVELALVLVVIHLVLLHHTITTQTQLQQANTTLTQIQSTLASQQSGGGGGLFGGLSSMMGPWGMAAAAGLALVGMMSGSGNSSSTDNGDTSGNENSGTIVVGDGSGGQNAPGLNQLSGSGAVAAAAAAAAKYIASQQFASALNTSSVIAATAAVAAAASAAMGKAKDSTSRKAAAVLGSLGGAQSAAAGAIDNSKRTNVSSTLTMGDVNVRSDADLQALQASLALFTINTDITGRYSLGRVTT